MVFNNPIRSLLGHARAHGLAIATAAVATALYSASPTPSYAQNPTKVEKAFDGWLVTCVENAEAKRCSMRQSRVAPKTKQVLFAWTIVAGADKKLTNVLVTPTGVALQDGIRLSFGDSAPVQVNYGACGPRACQALMPFDDTLLERMQSSPKIAVNFVQANKRLVQTEVDMKGFSNAYAYLTDQIK